MKINVKNELNTLDKERNTTNLVNMYEACKLSLEDKKTLAEMLVLKKDVSLIESFLTKRLCEDDEADYFNGDDTSSFSDTYSKVECAWCGRYFDASDLENTDFGKICHSCKLAIESKEGPIDDYVYDVIKDGALFGDPFTDRAEAIAFAEDNDADRVERVDADDYQSIEYPEIVWEKGLKESKLNEWGNQIDEFKISDTEILTMGAERGQYGRVDYYVEKAYLPSKSEDIWSVEFHRTYASEVEARRAFNRYKSKFAIKETFVKGPRGEFKLSSKSAKDLKKDGYGFHHEFEKDGKSYQVLTKDSQSLAILKEEYGAYKDEPYCEEIADRLEHGFWGGYTGNNTHWELDINGLSRSEFSPSFADYLAEEVAFPVRDGHLNYMDLDIIMYKSSMEHYFNFDNTERLAENLMKLGVDREDIDEWLKSSDDDAVLEFWVDYDTNFNVDDWEANNEEEEEETPESLGLPSSVTVTASELQLDTDDEFEDDEILDEILSDYLSDTYGYCHFGFNYERVYNEFKEPSEVIITDIEWDLSESLKEKNKTPLTENTHEKARVCSFCGRKMWQGYVVNDGEEYYCSDDCLRTEYNPIDIEEMSNNAEIGNEADVEYNPSYGELYWTEWEIGDDPFINWCYQNINDYIKYIPMSPDALYDMADMYADEILHKNLPWKETEALANRIKNEVLPDFLSNDVSDGEDVEYLVEIQPITEQITFNDYNSALNYFVKEVADYKNSYDANEKEFSIGLHKVVNGTMVDCLKHWSSENQDTDLTESRPTSKDYDGIEKAVNGAIYSREGQLDKLLNKVIVEMESLYGPWEWQPGAPDTEEEYRKDIRDQFSQIEYVDEYINEWKGIEEGKTLVDLLTQIRDILDNDLPPRPNYIDDGLFESTKFQTLNEGTSNFSSLNRLPLLVFDVYNFDDDFEHESPCVYLDEYQFEELKKDLENFNLDTKSIANDLYYTAYDIYIREHTDEEQAQADKMHDESSWLEDFNITIEDGYYEAAQLYANTYNGELFDNISQENADRIINFFAEMKKKYNLTELKVSYRFSNGETGYENVDKVSHFGYALHSTMTDITFVAYANNEEVLKANKDLIHNAIENSAEQDGTMEKLNELGIKLASNEQGLFDYIETDSAISSDSVININGNSVKIIDFYESRF